MDANELELLKKVLPPFLKLDDRKENDTRYLFDEEGEPVLELHTKDTLNMVVARLMDRSRFQGVAEGRAALQRELLKTLGVHETLHGIIVNANEMETDLRQLTRTVEGLVKKG